MEQIFKNHCGPDVQYLSHERIFREIRVLYKIPAFDADRVFTIRVTPVNGLLASTYRAMLRAANSARIHAYHATGKLEADTKQLLQGMLVNEAAMSGAAVNAIYQSSQGDPHEYPRSDAQAAEVSPSAAIDPES